MREVREEIGLSPGADRRSGLFKIDARKETGWEFCWIYRCESEGPFVLHPDEIETGAWFAPDAVTKWVNEKPQDFASAFVLIWRKYLTADYANASQIKPKDADPFCFDATSIGDLSAVELLHTLLAAKME